MYDKKYAMDSDYREYTHYRYYSTVQYITVLCSTIHYTHYRDRGRGEFLTRGAALSSQQSAAAAQQTQAQQIQVRRPRNR